MRRLRGCVNLLIRDTWRLAALALQAPLTIPSTINSKSVDNLIAIENICEAIKGLTLASCGQISHLPTSLLHSDHTLVPASDSISGVRTLPQGPIWKSKEQNRQDDALVDLIQQRNDFTENEPRMVKAEMRLTL